MARKKGPVIAWHPDPDPVSKPVVGVPPEEDLLETPSGSFSTSSRTSICPHCNSAFQDLSIIDFRDHVAFCTRPSTANGGTSESSLSTPPVSPSQMAINTITVDVSQRDVEKDIEEFATQANLNVGRQPVGDPVDCEDAEYGIRPYVNPATEFDYYGQEEVQEGSDLEPKPAVPTEKFPFPKATPIEVFDDYLKDPEDMSYEELYRRTAIVSGNLHAWQTEWDVVEKEIYAYEKALKADEKKAYERSKEALEAEKSKEKWAIDQIGETFKAQLSLSGKKFQEWAQDFQSKNPDDTRTISQLHHLRSPQYAALVKKQKKADFNARKKLENEPLPEYKPTKEEIEEEKRKRGRLMDPVKFNDMRMADVYGFEYSSHAKHYAQQPMPARNAPVNPNPSSSVNPNSAVGQVTSDASRARTQRKKTRKIYEAEESPTPETEEEGQVPAKRTRKPKIFQDGVEITGPPRTSGSNTPAVRTFASGKRVGRPPTKSKLQAVQLAQPSETPDPTSGNDTQNPDGLEEHDHGGEPRELAPSQEAQLHDAAELLVNQTVSDKAEAILPAVKPKHPGGRPRKVGAGSTTTPSSSIPAPDAAQAKPRNKGGRPKKNPAPVEIEAAAGTMNAGAGAGLNPKAKGGRRVKKEAVPQDNMIQLGEENGVLESTEQDDGSRYTSAATTRPTTSDSNATFSTVASRRSARPATRDKTNAREANARVKSEGGSANAQDQSTQPSSSGRSKRKRGSDDTDLSPIIVDSAPVQMADPVPKKRRTRTIQQESDDMIEAIPENLPEASTSRSKRKRGDTVNDSIAVEDPYTIGEIAPVLKKRKRGVNQEKDKTVEVEEEDSDAGIDEESLDPVAREALRKKRVKKEKSRKLSRNMKARWASGGMKEAQETRKANNARKKAEKEAIAAAEAAGLPPPIFPPHEGPAPAPAKAKATPKAKAKLKSKAKVDTEDEVESGHEIEVELETDDDEEEEEEEEEAEEEDEAEEDDDDDDDDDDEVAPKSMTITPAATAPSSSANTTSKKIRRNRPILPPRPASTRVRKPTRTALGLDGVDDDDDDLEQQFASEYDKFQALSSPKSPVMLGKRVRRSLVDLSQVMGETDEDEDEDEEF